MHMAATQQDPDPQVTYIPFFCNVLSTWVKAAQGVASFISPALGQSMASDE
jgi:hypothetical protein